MSNLEGKKEANLWEWNNIQIKFPRPKVPQVSWKTVFRDELFSPAASALWDVIDLFQLILTQWPIKYLKVLLHSLTVEALSLLYWSLVHMPILDIPDFRLVFSNQIFMCLHSSKKDNNEIKTILLTFFYCRKNTPEPLSSLLP